MLMNELIMQIMENKVCFVSYSMKGKKEGLFSSEKITSVSKILEVKKFRVLIKKSRFLQEKNVFIFKLPKVT